MEEARAGMKASGSSSCSSSSDSSDDEVVKPTKQPPAVPAVGSNDSPASALGECAHVLAILSGYDVASCPWLSPWESQLSASIQALHVANQTLVSEIQGTPDPKGHKAALHSIVLAKTLQALIAPIQASVAAASAALAIK